MFKKVATPTIIWAVLAYSGAALSAEPINVGFTATLTGDFASYGVDIRNGFDIGLADIIAKGGPQISATVVDDHGQANDGVLAAGKFCENPATVAVVGYTFSSIALAAVPILQKCKMPVVATAVTSPALSGINKYFRRVILTDAVQGRMMGNYAVKTMGAKSVYVLYQQDDYGIGVSKAFKDAYTAAGAKLAGEDSYLLGTKNFRTILARLKASNPDTIFIGGFYTEAAMIAEQARALGIQSKLLGTDGSLAPQLIQLSGGAVEGMTLYGMFDPGSAPSRRTAEFVAAYAAKYQQQPSAWAALGYDTALTIGHAVKVAQAKGAVNREGLNAALSDIKDLAGATGNIAFQSNGDRTGALYYFCVRGGKFVLAEKQ